MIDGRYRALPQFSQPTGDCHAREESQEDRTQTRRLQEEAEEAPRSRRRLKLGLLGGAAAKEWCALEDSNLWPSDS